MRKALFLDRDGTINVDKGYVYKPEDFIFVDGIKQVIKKYNQEGYLVIVVTNQSGVARGYYTEDDVVALHKYADTLLFEEGARIDKWYYCPHHPVFGVGKYKTDCTCRKPKTGMLEQAISQFGIDPAQSLLVGDKVCDIECGNRMGIKALYVDEFLKLWSGDRFL